MRDYAPRLAGAPYALFSKVAQRVGRKISLSVFQHLFRMSLRYHLERRTGELARAIDRGVKAVTFMLGVVLFNIVPTLFEFALVIGILLAEYDWPFALITFVTISAYAGFTIVATEWRTRFRRIMNTQDNAVIAQAVDSLLNYETVKTFINEAYERERFDRTLTGYERAATKSQVTLAALNFGQGAIVALGVTAIMIVAAQGVVAGTLTAGRGSPSAVCGMIHVVVSPHRRVFLDLFWRRSTRRPTSPSRSCAPHWPSRMSPPAMAQSGTFWPVMG